MFPSSRLAAGVFALALPVSAASALAAEVNVYTYREQPLIQPIFDRFTKETGVRVNVVYSNKGLEERIKAEGAASPADLFLTVDVSLLTRLRDMGLTQPIVVPEVVAAVPAQFRDPKGDWVGLTYRARVVYVSKERVKETALTYDDLADPKWKGKICTRSGQHPYNVALLAGLIAREGAAAAEKWAAGVKANLATKPSGNDRSQVKSIFAGECDVALGNTYYYGLMATNEKEPEQKQWAGAVRAIFPTFKDGGTHVNISGVSLIKTAPNKAEALKLVAFMLSDEAQKLYAELNYEYPVKAGAKVTPLIEALGPVKADGVDLNVLSSHRPKASEILDTVRFDDGPAS